MGDLSSSGGGDIFCSGSSEGGFGLRYRGGNSSIHQSVVATRQTSFIYSDETGLSAAIEYVDDGNGSEAIPVFVTKAGNKVYIPPSIADLLRDKPPDCDGGEFEDDENGGGDKCSSLVRIGDSDYDSDYGYDSTDELDDEHGSVGWGHGTNGSLGDDNNGTNDSDEELGGVQVISKMRKSSRRARRRQRMLERRSMMNHEEDDDDFLNFEWLSNFWEQFKYVGPRLLPFVKTAAVYFVLFIPEESPSLFAMMIKCLPVMSLALFIVLHGIGLSEEHKFSRRILTGLIFSCLGDAFLIWPQYFLCGMAAFGVAQSFYIRAFGFESVNWKLGFSVFTVTSSSLFLILPGLMSDAMPIMIGVLIYSLLLTTMLWRAMDRADLFSEEPFSWSKMSSCIGAISFAISDTILALNQFYMRIPYHQILVMTTYYAAQLGIALSVVTTTTRETTQKNDKITNDLTDPVDSKLSEGGGLNAEENAARHRSKGKSVI